MIKVVLFDIDGVLVDSKGSNYRYIRDTMKRLGYTVTEEDYKRLFHKTGREVVKALVPEIDKAELEEIRKLPPKQRLKRLQELEEKRKKQEEEAKKIIEDSLKEIKLDEMLEEIEVPQQEEVDIDKLFEQSKDVEEQISAADIKKIEEGGTDYAKRIQELLPQDRMEMIQQFYQYQAHIWNICYFCR